MKPIFPLLRFMPCPRRKKSLLAGVLLLALALALALAAHSLSSL